MGEDASHLTTAPSTRSHLLQLICFHMAYCTLAKRTGWPCGAMWNFRMLGFIA